MANKVVAAVKIAAKQTEVREFDLPDVPPDGGLLKVEAAGICGSAFALSPGDPQRAAHHGA